MNLFRFLICVFLVLMEACSRSNDQKEQIVSIPFVKSSFAGSPCVDVKIEGKVFPMELDLGLEGDLSGHSSFIHQLANKALLGTKMFLGFKGDPREKNLYQIPKLEIGETCFDNPILQEHDDQFNRDCEIGMEEEPVRDPGRLGWKLFVNSLLLIDAPSQKMILADNWNALEENGWLKKNFIVAPLFLDEGLVEFDLQTEEGVLHCFLDTGSTWNILNRPLPEGKVLEEWLFDTAGEITYSDVSIGDVGVEPITFRTAPIACLRENEALVGMEFIEHHRVLIDFKDKKIYLERVNVN